MKEGKIIMALPSMKARRKLPIISMDADSDPEMDAPLPVKRAKVSLASRKLTPAAASRIRKLADAVMPGKLR